MKDIDKLSESELREQLKQYEQKAKSAEGRLTPMQQQNAALQQQLAQLQSEMDKMKADREASDKAAEFEQKLGQFQEKYEETDGDFIRDIAEVAAVKAAAVAAGNGYAQSQPSYAVRDYMLVHDEGVKKFTDRTQADENFKQWVVDNPEVFSAMDSFQNAQDANTAAYFGGLLGDSVRRYEQLNKKGADGSYGSGFESSRTAGVRLRDMEVDGDRSAAAAAELRQIQEEMRTRPMNAYEWSQHRMKEAKLRREINNQ